MPVRFSNYLMDYFAELDSAKNWVRQLHVGALRNPNGAALRDLGPDTGFDAIADFTYMAPLGRLLDRSAQQGTLPRTILYNLNPRDNAALAVLCGSFQDGVTAGKMQYGAAWWFMDQMDGMTRPSGNPQPARHALPLRGHADGQPQPAELYAA